jgi:thiol-disulfide isomerase/thioredoxin
MQNVTFKRRMKRIILFAVVTVICLENISAQMRDGWWRMELIREDGQIVPFNFEVKTVNGKKNFFVRNATERIKVDRIEFKKDSVLMEMPVFESRFHGRIMDDGSMEGVWIRATSTNDIVLHFRASPGIQDRFPIHQSPAQNITGRWAVVFVTTDTSERNAVAEFKQDGNNLMGTFLTTTGDYRYLEGVVDGDSLLLSTFDGSHAYLFKAKIKSASILQEGHYYAGAKGHQEWTAKKDATAHIAKDASAVYLRPGEDRLHFTFPDLSGKNVSINDARFKNKVVIVQIMGSWCPNCMDETKFLSDFYLNNRSKGIEIISLAYEYSDDFQRSKNSLLKFKKRFNVQYPMLITGARTSDSLRTEKTLPEITPIKMFPTTIFIGRDGRVKKFDTGFTGPGTGEHYEEFKKRFNETIASLLRQQGNQ